MDLGNPDGCQHLPAYNNHRYHEAIDNMTPSDRFFGRNREKLERRQKVKEDTMRLRRKLNRGMGLLT
jgi:hypothetical protein